MLFANVVDTSRAVTATRSRLAKRELIADLLRSTPREDLELVTSYLAGTLPQRRTGIGWRSLTTLPAPASTPSLDIGELDAELQSISELAGPGAGRRRQDAVSALFAALTAPEQDHLAALLTGNLRQGALDSVMLEAIARAADVSVGAVRRAAMFSAPTGPIAVAALNGGVGALETFDLVVGRPVRPMLAGSAPDVAAAVEKMTRNGSAAGAWVVDAKLDGIRIQVHKRDDQVAIFTRSLEEISARLPDVVEVARGLPGSFVLDGEALAVDESGRPRAFQDTASTTSTHARPGGVRPWFFDLLHHDGVGLVTAPLSTRLQHLDDLVPERWRVSRLVTEDPDESRRFFEEVIAEGREGVIVKNLAAPYDSGRRGAGWVKVKPRHTLDLVVLAAEWGSGRRTGTLSNIHLGARTGEGPDTAFVMLGKTFKGMTDQMLAWQTERFLGLETTRTDSVVRLRPEQVVEVAFDGVQRSTRYPGGVVLRFARVLRYREDKSPAEADTIDSVRAYL